LLVGVHGVEFAAGQGHRGPRSGQQLRHVWGPDGERGRIHDELPLAVPLPQPGIHGRVFGRHQAGQARDAQVAGGGLVARGEPGWWPMCCRARPVQLFLGPGDLDPQAEDGLNRQGEVAAGQGQADDAA
jgi:hypothetical protein